MSGGIRDLGEIDGPTVAEMMAARDASLATLTPPISPYGGAPAVPVAAPSAAPVPQSTDPAAPYYVNPASPYYKNPNARVIPLGNSTPAPPPPAPADPNRYAQQSTDPSAPYYVNPASPYFNPKAPKPVPTGSGAFVRAPADAAEPIIGPVDKPPVQAGNKYASGGGGAAGGPSEPPGINWAGASGTATIPAHEQPVVTGKRQTQLLGAIEGQKSAAEGSADAAANIETAKGQGAQDVARSFEDAGVDAKLRAQAAADQAKAFRAKIDEFSAKVAKDKINPNRMWEDSTTGQKIAWTMAKALGAVGQAFLHQPSNQVADHIDNMVAQDIAAQRANHEVGRERVADMNTFYGHALRETASAEEAERVATGYALEAAKQQAQAMTLNAGSAAQKAKGKEVTALLDEKLAEKGIAMNPLVQARTVSAGPDMKDVLKTARSYVDDQAKLGTVVKPDDAIRWAYKMHTGRDPLPGAGGFAGGAKAEPGSKQEKLDAARTEVTGGIGTIDRALDSGAAYKQGPIGAMWAHVPGATDSKKDALERAAYNAQVKGLVGAAWKLTTDGMEPKNPGIIEELSGHYQIEPSDSPELAREKMKRLQQTLRDAATSKGVIADEANRDLKGIPSAFKNGGGGAAPSSFAPVSPAPASPKK